VLLLKDSYQRGLAKEERENNKKGKQFLPFQKGENL